MKRILQIVLLGLCVMTGGTSMAQDRTVTGKVTSAEDGQGVPGVNVLVQGTTVGSVTDTNGNYTIALPAGNTVLVFSFIGFKSQEIEVGDRTTVDVPLQPDFQQLSEVVVTALGIERNEKSLSYSAQQVKADEKLRITRDADLNSTLAGKVAGVQVLNQSGAKLGSAATIRIRGSASLTEKSPLYVIDGTPVNNFERGARGVSPVDLGINMDDVESISILKGPNATALYGQRGDAGVVQITTKRGRKSKGIGLEVNSTTTFEEVNILPSYQNTYGGGGSSDFRTFTYNAGVHPAEWAALDGKRYHDYSDDASWGPKIDGSEYIPWYAWYPGTAHSFKTAKYTAQPDNVRDYYETGKTFNNNINFSKSGEGYSVRVSYTNLKQSGILPNTSLDRNYISTQNSAELGRYVTIGSNINYTNEVVFGNFDDDYSNYSGAGSFNQWFHRDLDMSKLKELRNFKTPTGALASWNHANPTAATTFSSLNFNRGNYWYNPYSYMDYINFTTKRDRLFGDVNLTVKLNEHFRVQGFFRRNQLSSNYEDKTPDIIERSVAQTNAQAAYSTGQTSNVENNYEFLASYNQMVSDFDIDVNIGGNIRQNSYKDVRIATNGGLVVPDLFIVSNSKGALNYYNYRQSKTVRSLYGRASVGYKDFAFLEFTARNDWSSALPTNNNSYFYPSIGGSFVFSELTQTVIQFLSYGKLRGSWAQVGSDMDPYQLYLTYPVDQIQFDGNILMTTPDLLTNADIKPSLSSAYEMGFDLKFLNNRAGISFTYYKEVKKNEILNVDISTASGFSDKVINAGRVERNGIEILLEGTPVSTRSFEWNIGINLARNNSRVIELADGVNSINATTPGYDVSDYFDFVYLVNKTDYDGASNKWGQLRGTGIRRINGQPVLNDNGIYQTENDVFFGSVLPDFTGGIVNNFTYKDFSLAVAIDFQRGGKYFSLSNLWGEYSGLLSQTAATNGNGKNVRDAVAEGGGIHVTGVNENGEPVAYDVAAYNYFHQFADNSVLDNSVFDASYVKLREISLGYRVPLKSRVLQNLTFSVVARNPWLIYLSNRNVDASELSQRWGENGQQPGTRSLGFNIKASF